MLVRGDIAVDNITESQLGRLVLGGDQASLRSSCVNLILFSSIALDSHSLAVDHELSGP